MDSTVEAQKGLGSRRASVTLCNGVCHVLAKAVLTLCASGQWSGCNTAGSGSGLSLYLRASPGLLVHLPLGTEGTASAMHVQHAKPFSNGIATGQL